MEARSQAKVRKLGTKSFGTSSKAKHVAYNFVLHRCFYIFYEETKFIQVLPSSIVYANIYYIYTLYIISYYRII